MRALAANRAHENIPPLEAKHLDNARLFANRKDLISSIPSIQGGVVAEVGSSLLSMVRPVRNETATAAFFIKGVYSLTRRSQRLLASLVRTSCHRRKVKLGIVEQRQFNLLAEGGNVDLRKQQFGSARNEVRMGAASSIRAEAQPCNIMSDWTSQ